MKKYRLIMASCAALAMTSVSAAEGLNIDFNGFMQVRGFAYDNLNGNDNVNDSSRGVDQRYRLWTNAALNEHAKAVFAIEMDSTWGDNAVGKVGADETGAIEIKHLYLDLHVPGTELHATLGAQGYWLGDGFIQGDDASGMQLHYTLDSGDGLHFAWTKLAEGDPASHKQDADYYQLQYSTQAGGWNVSPFVGYLNGQPTGLGLRNEGFSNDFESWYLGVEADGNIGDIRLQGTLIANSWDNDADITGTDVSDGNGLAVRLKGTYRSGATAYTVEGAHYGDSKIGEFINVRGYNNFSEIITGGRFDGRSAMGGSSAAATGTRGDYYMNYQYLKLGAEHNLNPRHKLSAYYIFAQEAQDNVFRANSSARALGHEIDVYFDCTLAEGVTLTVGGGYLIADDDFGAGDDAWKVGTAVTYRF
ncbi:hypothetical protein Selin_0044 [Desulfurispirillum indicum S5]|uniref:Alginate export domain-containing protein n=1 Tax=Desulfurispirillum indicum (strain ATCC BAA-1389 / DSM 22839 / S5) TaxID=653733 RepID=E6W4S5_DESIS|nr:hypothetical protein [Desulfurispirillum indicum]ADU64803.1 hypothetical protein Selin_0044 [Desulfurispirillum indicum S5]